MRNMANHQNLNREGAQIPFLFDVIRLDKTITLERPRKIKDIACSKASLDVVSELLTDYSTRFKRFYWGRHFEAMSTLLANLYAHGNRQGILYSRNNSGKGDRLIMALVDYLAEQGLIVSTIQPRNEAGCSSFIQAKPELIRRLNIAKVRIAKSKDHRPLVLRDKNKKELSTTRLQRHTPREFKRLTKAVELHNSWWENNSATLSTKPVIPVLHRVFNKSESMRVKMLKKSGAFSDSDSFSDTLASNDATNGQALKDNPFPFLGGRYYGIYQGIPSKDRAKILFNGKQTVEIDYKSIHISILYSWAGVSMIGDPYIVDGYERSVVKSIMLRLVNAKSLSHLRSVITSSAKESRKSAYKEYKESRAAFERDTAKSYKARAPYKPKWIDSHIKNIPTGFDAKRFIDDFMARHSAIAEWFGSDDIGLKLQLADSELMTSVMVDLYDRKKPIPVLPVHDSLICRKSNLELVRLTMRHHFKKMFGTSIQVTVDQN